MQDFDANDDQPTLPATGQEQSAQPGDQGTPVVPRARDDAPRHRDRRSRRRDPRVRPALTQRRRALLRACDGGGRPRALRSHSARRRLWTTCHGRPPGSPR